MKKVIVFLLSILIVLSSVLLTQAQSNLTDIDSNNLFIENVWKYRIKDDGTAEINEYTGNDSVVVLPCELGNTSVTSIASAAFYRNKFTEVTLPSTLKEIGWWSFYGCEKLERINFNNGLNIIEFGAFINCKKLKSVDIPVTVYKIGKDAFAVNCSSDKDIKDKYSKKIISKQHYSLVNDFSISGFSGSYTEKYAIDNNFDFISKGKVDFCDADLDNKIDINDVEIINEYIKEDKILSTQQLVNADVNCDSKVNQTDATIINNYIRNLIEFSEIPACSNLKVEHNFLNNMKMYCDGDSIAKGTGTNIMGNDFYSYCNYISETYDVEMINKAVPGTTIAKQVEKTDLNTRSILERIQELEGEYDIILLDGGFNDLFQNIGLGEITPNSDKSGIYDEYTTAGALESICYILNKNYKDSLKLFVLGHKRYRNKNQEVYWSLIRNVLKKWDIEYIDLSKETDLCDINDEIVTQYFMYKDRYSSGDGVHPLEYTNRKVYGPYVGEKLNSIEKNRNNLYFDRKDVDLGIFEKFSILPYINSDKVTSGLSWYSENPDIVQVDDSGQIVAKRLGTTIIRAESSLGLSSSYRVRVNFMPMALMFNTNKKTLFISEKYKLKTTVLKGTASYNKYYTSSNPDVAYVDYKTGEVTALSQGTTVITCRTYSGAKAICEITVKQNKLPEKTDINLS